ncbi:MAG: SHOCT domain-containing protein [Oscillospiraceae bacterium]|nr:SHOCT domain-containing protein [Oscillospiraceae bacterium]
MNIPNDRYPTNLNNSISRAQGTQSSQTDRFAGRGENNKKGGVWTLLIFPVILAASLLPEGYGFLIVPIVMLLLVVVGLIAVVRSQKRDGQSAAPKAAGGRQSSSPYSMTASDGHLCEDARHSALEPGQFNAIDEMEAGYRPAGSTSVAPTVSSASYSAHKMIPLSPEAYQRKITELRDLLAAGIISHEEYAQKLEDYRK